MRYWFVSLLLWCPVVRAEAPAADGPATRPVAEVRHALIISVDGLRPDMALRAQMPNLRRLMSRGSFTFWGRTTPVSITLPSHTSMLTGVKVERHGVTWNKDQPPGQQGYPAVPTLFEVAKKAGLSTGMAAGKSKFVALARTGSLDFSSVKEQSDDEVAQAAEEMIRDHPPDVLFVHFPDVDRSGHADGWGSAQQLTTIEHVDQLLGGVLAALDAKGLAASTLIIVTADHGGAGRSHGADDPRSRHIPWIAAGPGIRADFDLTQDPTLVVNTEDTFATACALLALRPPEALDGKPVWEILARQELLHAEP